jgi:uncharacterized protein YndB with AHSA1/START domain
MKEVIRLSRIYPVSAAAVWRALTEPALLAQWWAPGDVKAEVGHRFDLDMGQWGKQACEVTEVEPERLLRYKFATGRLDTIITWRLTPEATGTRLTLTHEGFDVDSPMGRAAFDGMKNGWPGVLGRLDKLLQAAS